MQVDMDRVDYIGETAMTIRDTRRRTTVPKAIVESLGLENGNRIRWILFEDGSILVTKVKS